jgi:hypothetical protein
MKTERRDCAVEDHFKVAIPPQNFAVGTEENEIIKWNASPE